MSDQHGQIRYREHMESLHLGGQFRSNAQQRTIIINAVPLDSIEEAQAEATRLGAPEGLEPIRTPRLGSAHVDLTWEWIDWETAEMVVDPS